MSNKTEAQKQENRFRNQIQPQIERLAARCRHYNIPMIFAASIDLGNKTGITVTHMEPDRAGIVPQEFLVAMRALEPQQANAAVIGAPTFAPAADAAQAA